jgi:predicted nucleic acid-binding protein
LVREQIKQSEIEEFTDLIEEKDAHVVAGAILTNCSHLVTLAKRHIDRKETKEKFLPKLKILSPRELLQSLV